MQSVNDILGLVLGGGQGKRLYPLTKLRAKPAVPIAGKYRLIDIPLSNCINAGIQKIAVLTQFKSVSLHRHIAQTYVFDSFSRGWVQILAAEQRSQRDNWYQGTADAVRKQLLEIQSAGTEYVLILAGDHLYRMDLDELANFHWDTEADITIAVQPIRKEDASRFGLLKSDQGGRILAFAEKPKDKPTLEEFVSREDQARPYLGSMGIYMFNTQILVDVLTQNLDTDFGGEVIPRAIDAYNVFGYNFDGYWEDIGTIRSFFETNLSLAGPNSPFNLTDRTDPIYSRPRFLPGSTIVGGNLQNVLLADGCCISQANISNAVIGLRSQIGEGVEIKNSILMGLDDYDDPRSVAASGGIPMGIGAGSQIEGAIIDKNVRMGENVFIKPFPRGTEIDKDDWVVQDGIVVIPKNTILPSGTRIEPAKT
jgi:glucose-1-phosphate adenylyltransferase